MDMTLKNEHCEMMLHPETHPVCFHHDVMEQKSPIGLEVAAQVMKSACVQLKHNLSSRVGMSVILQQFQDIKQKEATFVARASTILLCQAWWKCILQKDGDMKVLFWPFCRETVTRRSCFGHSAERW